MANRFFTGIGDIARSARDNVRQSKNLRDRNRDLDSDIQKNNEYFDQHYKSQSGDESGSPARVNYRTYPYDYFTGTNARIFFGDVWVDDIVSINYTASQTKEPIFGYASQTFDAVARGVVSVQGSFSVAFKEMGYLNLIHRLLEQQRQGASAALDHKLDEIREKAEAGKARYEPRLTNAAFTGQFGFSPTGQPQIVREQDTIEDILAFKKNGNIIASGLGAATISSPKADRDFEDFAELMEDTIWGDSNGNPLNRNFQFRRVDEFDYRYDSSGKDVGGIITSKTKYGDDYSRVLNILLTFGDLNDLRAEYTLVALNDVHLLGESMIVAPTGEPIAVNYNFFARNINQTITKNLAKNISPIKFDVGVEYEVSKLDDIEKIEQYLDGNDAPRKVFVKAKAAYDAVNGWSSDNTIIATLESTFTRNPWEPFIDELIKQVENAANNETYITEINTSKSQYIVEVTLSNAQGNNIPGGELTMVLEQKIPNTHTYRVISPTRQNFRAPQVFTRDDLWATIPPPQRPESIENEPKTKPDQSSGEVKAGRELNYDSETGEVLSANVVNSSGEFVTISKPTESRNSTSELQANAIATARADQLNLAGEERDQFIAQEQRRVIEEQERSNIQTNTSSSTTSTPTGNDIQQESINQSNQQQEPQTPSTPSNAPVDENISQRNQRENITLPEGVRLNSAGEPVNEAGFLVDPVTGDPVQFASAGTSDIYIDYGLRRYIENPDGTVSPLLPAQNAVNETYNGPLKRVDLTETPANVAETAFSSSNDAFIVARGEHHRIDPLHEASFQQNVSAIDFAPRPGETLVVGAFREGVITDIQPDAILVRTESGETDVYVHGLPLEGITEGTRISQDQAFFQTSDHLDYRVKAQNGRLLFNDQAVEERAIQGLQRQGYDVTDVVDYYAKDRQARIEEYQRNNLTELSANTNPE